MARLLTCLGLLILLLCPPPALAEEPDSLTIDPGVLRVGCLGGRRPPFLYPVKGGLAGFDLILVREMARELGDLRLRVLPYGDRASLTRALADQEVDCAVSGLNVNLDEAEYLLFSRPYARIGTVLLIDRLQRTARGLEFVPVSRLCRIMRGPRLAAPAWPGSAALVRRILPADRLYLVTGPDALVREMESGRAWGGFLDEAEARDLFDRRPELGLTIQYQPLDRLARDKGLPATGTTITLAVLFPYQRDRLRDWCDIFLEARGYTELDLETIRARVGAARNQAPVPARLQGMEDELYMGF